MKLRSMYPRFLSAGSKSLKTKIIFSVITKNSNWEILTKNLVLKDKMGLRMKNFNIFRVH